MPQPMHAGSMQHLSLTLLGFSPPNQLMHTTAHTAALPSSTAVQGIVRLTKVRGQGVPRLPTTVC